MANAEQRLWWYRALHHLVLDALALHPNGLNMRILDAGCGTGGLLWFLRERGYRNTSGFDVSPFAVDVCRRRNLPVHSGDLRRLAIAPEFDAIISNDTLYFFYPVEQLEILKNFRHSLAPNGLLIMNLPALNAFRGSHDLKVGITKRFKKVEALSLLLSAGFQPLRLTFWPFVLSPIIFLTRLVQRIRVEHMKQTSIRSDLTVTPPACNRLLEFLVRIENRTLPFKPFGSSLFVVAKSDSREPRP